MNNVFAFVVGIDAYDEPGWTISGPCRNALAIVQWLLEIGTPPKNISLFLEIEDQDLQNILTGCQQLEKVAEEIGTGRLKPKRSATSDQIDTFWRLQLREEKHPKSCLFMYWSGHGYADNNGDRIFICRDFLSNGLTNKVFNCTKVHRHLTGPGYQQFQEQICLADVCANHTDIEFITAKDVPKSQSKANQIAYFASPEGEYAKGDDGIGVFTRIALEVLESSSKWPQQQSFVKSMNDAFDKLNHSIFRVAFLDKGGGLPERRVGKVDEEQECAAFNSVFTLLDKVSLPDSTYRPYYLRTVNDLGEPGLHRAQGLTGMIRELASLSDSRAVPYGLLQFLVRLKDRVELKDTISTWLDEHAMTQARDLANIAEKLVDEKGTKILIVELASDNSGNLETYDVFFRTSTLAPVPGISFEQRRVSGWEAFNKSFVADIEQLLSGQPNIDLEIHFLADPPLFPKLFHNIETASGPLGEEYVVVLRHRTRLRSTKRLAKKAWSDYAEALRAYSPCDIELLAIPADPAQLPKGRGFCFTSFVLPPEVGRLPQSVEIKTLAMLLRQGTPYLFWLHSLPKEGGVEGIRKQIQGWLKDIDTLDKLPMIFSSARRAQNEFATQATLLWDDPQFNPFGTTVGVKVK